MFAGGFWDATTHPGWIDERARQVADLRAFLEGERESAQGRVDL